MRHSSVDLTMNVYTDPRLLDMRAAVDALPSLLLEPNDSRRELATGTDGRCDWSFEPSTLRRTVAPTVAPTVVQRGPKLSSAVQIVAEVVATRWTASGDLSRLPVTKKKPLSIADNGWREVERKGVEPSTSALRTQRSPN
ncbi:MAG: hypothetical protein RIS70_42 [Planctomycetota bacterium]